MTSTTNLNLRFATRPRPQALWTSSRPQLGVHAVSMTNAHRTWAHDPRMLQIDRVDMLSGLIVEPVGWTDG